MQTEHSYEVDCENINSMLSIIKEHKFSDSVRKEFAEQIELNLGVSIPEDVSDAALEAYSNDVHAAMEGFGKDFLKRGLLPALILAWLKSAGHLISALEAFKRGILSKPMDEEGFSHIHLRAIPHDKYVAVIGGLQKLLALCEKSASKDAIKKIKKEDFTAILKSMFYDVNAQGRASQNEKAEYDRGFFRKYIIDIGKPASELGWTTKNVSEAVDQMLVLLKNKEQITRLKNSFDLIVKEANNSEISTEERNTIKTNAKLLKSYVKIYFDRFGELGRMLVLVCKKIRQA